MSDGMTDMYREFKRGRKRAVRIRIAKCCETCKNWEYYASDCALSYWCAKMARFTMSYDVCGQYEPERGNNG